MRAQIRVVVQNPGVVAIEDQNLGAMSVTNDAEAVVEFLWEQRYLFESGSTRVVYRDSEGVWDELVWRVHQGRAKFVGFKPLRVRTLEQALTMVGRA